VLQREGGGGDHDPALVEQAGHEVGQRLAGAGAGLDEQVAPVGHRLRDRLGHLHLPRPLGPAERLDGVGQDLAESAEIGRRVGHPSTLVVGGDGGGGALVTRCLPIYHAVAAA
jgi:hypothetical protein